MKISKAIVAVVATAAAMLAVGPTCLASGLNLGPVHLDVSPTQSTAGANLSVGVSAPSLGVEVGATADASLQVGGSAVGATVGAGASVTSPVASASVSVPSTTVGASTSSGGGTSGGGTSGGSSSGGTSGGASSGASTPATGGTSSLSSAGPGSTSAQSGATPLAGSQATKDSASTVRPVARRPTRVKYATEPAARNGGEVARAQADGATGALAGVARPGGDRDGLLATLGRMVATAATAAARSVWFPIALLIAFGLYLILQRRLDRGPKLLATGHGSPEDEVIEI